MMKIRKKVKLKKKVFLLMALGIMIPLAFSSFKNISFAMPVLGRDKNSKSTLINEFKQSSRKKRDRLKIC